jgi:tripartite-type tricarboxylate transporter receptor subunit TctC
MTLVRRRFLQLAAVAPALPSLTRLAAAQTYPARPIRWIVGFPPGGATDVVARLLAQWLSGRLGQPVVVENRPGAGNNVAVQTVVNSPPDGHTLLLVAAASTVNATLYKQLPFNFLRDIAPVAGIAGMPLVMEVNPSFPARTVAEFIAYAKANPSRLNIASSGVGTVPHLAGEMFKAKTNITMTHVPYRGEPPALADLIGGQVQVMFGALSASIEHLRAGRLRALAVTSTSRAQALPMIPTIGELMPGYEASTWFGVGAPTGTSGGIIDRLNREINAGLADPSIKARLGELGATPLRLSPAEFGAHIAAETRKWAVVVDSSGAKPESAVNDALALQ